MNMRDIRNVSKEDLLEMMGLQTKSSTSGWRGASVAMLAIGAVLGAAAALLLTPNTGREMRHVLRERIRSYSQRLAHKDPEAQLPH